MGQREEIAGRLVQAREAVPLDRKDAAESMCVPYQTYAAHENANRTFDVEAAVQYARRFKVSLDWLLTGAGRGPGGVQVEAPITSAAGILSFLNRIENLRPDNVNALMSVIQGFQQANAARPSPPLPDDRSESATAHRG